MYAPWMHVHTYILIEPYAFKHMGVYTHLECVRHICLIHSYGSHVCSMDTCTHVCMCTYILIESYACKDMRVHTHLECVRHICLIYSHRSHACPINEFHGHGNVWRIMHGYLQYSKFAGMCAPVYLNTLATRFPLVFVRCTCGVYPTF